MRSIVAVIGTIALAIPTHAALISSTAVIPSPYKVDRFEHRSGAAAAWKTQKLAGGSFKSGKSKSKFPGLPEVEEDTKTFKAYTYQHYSPFTFEAVFSKEDEEDDFTPSTESEITDLKLRVGSRIPNSSLAFGIDYDTRKDKSEILGSSTTGKGNRRQLSTSFKLQESIFLGAGLIQEEYEPDGGSSEDDDSFYVGAGYSKDNLGGEAVLTFENEEGVKTYTLISQGAMAVGSNQIVGQLVYFSSKNDGVDEKLSFLALGGGYYFDLTNFYVQPELGYHAADVKEPGGDVESSTILASVEVGVRTDAYNLYLSVGKLQGDSSLSGAGELETEETQFEVGAHAYF